ncbi:hypothetical protein H2199_005334 [Coniosporium tulheliwenetii]|uniref:Uncharacterized protein n=1 Tax=Coniosporium tulheliwenetii TaxID=3383036 RepID=A0ACC2Z2A4_9PEZI|nr:hypothetical protein H2199_005334 [Cladosporium sp. JES 115]
MQSGAAPASQPASGLPTFPEDHRPPWEAAERPAEASAQPARPSSVETPRASAAGEQPRLDIPQMGSQSEQPVSPVQHQSSWGLRSAVDKAFERHDDVSVPPTPVSSGISPPESDVSRSNTNSTSGISPILSRAPSAATAAMRVGDAPTPATPEGTNQFQIPKQRLGSTDSTATLQNLQQTQRRTPPGHSRNISNESYRRNLGTPSPGNSPARSPAIKAQTQLPEPEVAQLETVSPTDFTTREADVAAVINNSSNNEVPIAAQATKDAPAAFLEHRKNTSDADFNPVPRTGSPASRSGSPGKGRVRDLAEKFDADSRRNSTHSVESRRSVVSWTGSTPAGSRSNSPVKEEAPSKALPSERPAADRVMSFRPKLPGGWESFATTTGSMTPTDAPEDSRTRQEPPAPSTLRQSTVPDTQTTPTQAPLLEEEDSEPDFTPTTKKRSVAPAGLPDPLTDPLGAAAYAGSAMAEALKASMGLGEDTEAEERKEEARRHEEPRKNRSVGDVFLRPLALDRKASSIASSSAPPTPPPKDDSVFDTSQRGTYGGLSSAAAPLNRQDAGFSAQEAPSFGTARPPLTSELSTDTSLDDLESDRLRKEIEQSLNDPRTSAPGYADPEPTMPSHLAPDSQASAKRESSILPSEYDSYWASRNSYQPEQPRLSAENPGPVAELQSEPPMQQETSRTPDTTVTEAAPAKTIFDTRPDLLNQRFSWENSQSDLSRQPSVNAPVSELSADTSNDTPRAGSPLLQVIDEDPKLQQFDGVRGAYAGTVETGPSYQQQSVLANPQAAEQHLSRELPAGAAATLGMPQPSQAAHPAETPSRRSQEGLHVVNAESGDIPQLPSPEVHKPARESMIGPAELPAELSQQRPEQPLPPLPAQPVPHSPTQQDRIPPFREILQIKSAPDRIATYNRTRQQFAEMHTGLTDWTSETLAARPEHADVASAASQRRPSISATTPAGSMRHRHRAPSLSLPTLSTLPIFGNKSNASAAPQQESHSQPGAAGPSDPVYEGHGSSPGGASANREKMQAKGKELFHTAGVLSGKATVGAKGLFAKGKSRFRGSGGVEKVE